MTLKTQIKTIAQACSKEIIGIRRHLHQHPELSFEEYNTAHFISDTLTAYNIPHQTGIVKTGIVALIKGNNPNKKTVALRADIDALPIFEKNEVSYKSTIDGLMHACGHDVHTASLLGAAKILNSLKTEFEGTVKLIFQPGEEKLPGGASLMIKAGVLHNPRPVNIIGQHVFPSMEVGKVGFRNGMYMASTDELYIRVKGKGGHAAMPEQYINPLLIASEILIALQANFMNEVTKKIPNIPTVLAFGKINGMGATNVIPDEVLIEGTFRTMDETWRTEAHNRMKKIAQEIAKKMGGDCEFTILKGYPFLVNDTELTNQARQLAQDYLGKENVEELPLRMTAEDFAFYSQEIPACFYRLGTANANKGITAGVHTSNFDIDEAALEIGMGLMAWITINNLMCIK